MNDINFAIVGCGLISDTHAMAILDIPNAGLVGAWDLAPDRKESFCARYSITSYNTFEDLLEDKTVDAVCICTPSLFHKEYAIAALRALKHVVVEKPMALSASDAMELCKAADENDRLLTVISQNRFADDVNYLKDLIEKNSFGKLYFCDLYMKYYRSADYYSNSPWRGTLKYDGGGALMNQGIHGIDLMHYLVGKAKLISARTKTLHHKIEVEDCAVAMLEYDCGALGVIEASTCATPGFRRKIEINGENGYAVIRDCTLETIYLNGETIVSKNIDPHPSTASSPILKNFSDHKLQIENLIAAIMGDATLLVTPYDGYYAVKLIESIYNESRTHTEINLHNKEGK